MREKQYTLSKYRFFYINVKNVDSGGRVTRGAVVYAYKPDVSS